MCRPIQALNTGSFSLLLTLSLLLLAAAAVSGDKSADLTCSACRAVSRAILTAVSTTPSTKSSSVKENEKAKLARLSDAVERVCRNLPIHGRMEHQDKPDRWGLVAMTRDDGKPVDTEQLDTDSGLGNWLRMRCEEFLDEREEAVARQAVQQPKQLESWLCVQTVKVCTPEQLALVFVPPIDPVVASGAQKLDLNVVNSKPEL